MRLLGRLTVSLHRNSLFLEDRSEVRGGYHAAARCIPRNSFSG